MLLVPGARGSSTSPRWARSASTPASRCASGGGPRPRRRVPDVAARARAPPGASRTTSRCGSSATSGTGRSSRGSCCGRCRETRPGDARRPRAARTFWAARRARARRAIRPSGPGAARADRRAAVVRDRRGEGIAGVVGDLLTSGEPVLLVVADVPSAGAPGWRQLLAGLGPGGAARRAAWDDLAARPGAVDVGRTCCALDPPPVPAGSTLRGASPGGGPRCHLAWGEPERDFALARWRSRAGPAPGADRALPRAARRRDARRATRSSGAAGRRALPALGRTVRPPAARARTSWAWRADRRTAPPAGIAGARTDLDRSPAYRAYARGCAEAERVPGRRRARWSHAHPPTPNRDYTCPMPKVPRQKADKKPRAPKKRRGRGRTAAARPAVAEPDFEHGPVDDGRGPRAGRARQQLTDDERVLLGDLFAVIEEHAAEAAETVDRKMVERAFVFACERHADQRRASRRGLHHPPRRRREDLRRACASTPPRCAPRCCTTRSRTRARRSTRSARSSATRSPARRRRHQAHRDHLPEPRRPPGRELPQDDGRDGLGHPGHPDQARRPPAQHAHDRRDAEAQAAGEGEARRSRSSRRSRTGSASTRSSGSSRTSRSRRSTRASTRRSRGSSTSSARSARGTSRAPASTSARSSRPSASTPRSPAARSTSTRSTRR